MSIAEILSSWDIWWRCLIFVGFVLLAVVNWMIIAAWLGGRIRDGLIPNFVGMLLAGLILLPLAVNAYLIVLPIVIPIICVVTLVPQSSAEQGEQVRLRSLRRLKRASSGTQNTRVIEVAQATRRIVRTLPPWPIKQSLSQALSQLEELLLSIPAARGRGVADVFITQATKVAETSFNYLHRITDRVSGVVAVRVDYSSIASDLEARAKEIDQIALKAQQVHVNLGKLILADRVGEELSLAKQSLEDLEAATRQALKMVDSI